MLIIAVEFFDYLHVDVSLTWSLIRFTYRPCGCLDFGLCFVCVGIRTNHATILSRGGDE